MPKIPSKNTPEPNIAAQYIAEHIKQAMKKKALSTADMASATGIERTNMQRIYHGQKLPNPEQLKKIAEMLGIPMDQLMPDLPSACCKLGGDAMANQSVLGKKMKLDHVTFTATMDTGLAMAKLIMSKKHFD